jgi:hypothetical protein
MLLERLGNGFVRFTVFTVPVTSMSMTSVPETEPAAHSPAVAPETALSLAEIMASLSVHSPSSGSSSSSLLFTVMVDAWAGLAL